jgi:hypothetical protein
MRLVGLALVCAAALIFAAPSLAATASIVKTPDGSEVQYLAEPGQIDNLTLALQGEKYTLQASAARLTPVSPCTDAPKYLAGPDNMIFCPAAGVTSAFADLGDENDQVSWGFMQVPVPVRLSAGAGNDSVWSRDGFPDTIACGPGYDSVKADPQDTVAADCELVERAHWPDNTPVGGGATRADGIPIGVSINGGAAFTNDPHVLVMAYGPDATVQTLISNDGGFRDALSCLTGPGCTWTLDDNGTERLPKTVYVRFSRDGVDGTRTYTDDIILDTTSPAVATAKVDAHRVLHVVARDATSGLAAMQLRNGRNAAAQAFRQFVGRLRVGARIPRWVRVRDRAGNVSRWHAVARATGGQ